MDRGHGSLRSAWKFVWLDRLSAKLAHAYSQEISFSALMKNASSDKLTKLSDHLPSALRQ
jgi:hypothetical protein